jgi:prepilin-type N-terminal cleavage/methylation domain-containing protein
MDRGIADGRGCSTSFDPDRGFSLIEVLVVVSLMAFLAVYLGVETAEKTAVDQFYRTSYRMEDIKEAIIGRPNLYCNGIRQFTGYVSDTGNLPDLFVSDEEEKTLRRVTMSLSGRTEALEGDGGLAEALLNGRWPQPNALWKQMDNLPDWQYYADHYLWAGWRGPYIDPPAGGALRDEWGNRILFVIGDVIGHEGKTYRCTEDYAATRESQQSPGEEGAPWEVIAESEMNFRTWQDLGTVRASDLAGNPVEVKAEDIDETMKTEQEIFYSESCMTIISLGRDGRPGGDGPDKDLYITIEPAEFLGEVAGNAGDRGAGNLLAGGVCLSVPDFTDQGGEIKSWCIPQLEDNSRLLSAQPASGEPAYTGVDFRFGSSESFRRECLDWECNRTDGSCTCNEYEQGGCIRFECVDNLVFRPVPEGCTCTEWMYGFCYKAECDDEPDDWDCDCLEYESDDCLEWSCPEPVPGADCECASLSDPIPDDTNTLPQDISIGIRTLVADSAYPYTVAVHPGGNWIGTVRGEQSVN